MENLYHNNSTKDQPKHDFLNAGVKDGFEEGSHAKARRRKGFSFFATLRLCVRLFLLIRFARFDILQYGGINSDDFAFGKEREMSRFHPRRRGRRLRLLTLAASGFPAMAAVTLPAVATAQTSQWVGGNSGDWNTASHWNPSGEPGANDTVNVTSAAGVTQTISYDYTGSAVTLNELNLGLTGGSGTASETINMSTDTLTANNETVGYSGAGGNGIGMFDQSGGLNNIDYNLYLGANTTDKGSYNLSAGSLSASGAVESVGYDGTGIFNQTGGANSSGGLEIAYTNSGATGTYNLSAGSLSVVEEAVGYSGAGIFNQTGGTNTIPGGGELDIGAVHDSVGTYTLSAGSATVNGNAYVGGLSAGAGGAGTLTVSNAGQMTVTGSLEIYPGSQNVLNLNGGSLTVGILSFSSPFNQFVWTSGTLHLTGASDENITIDSTSAANFGDSAGTANSFVLGAGQALEVNGNEYMGYNGTGNFSQTGGANAIIGGHQFYVGLNAGTNGTYTLSGGSLLVASFEDVADSGTGTFNQSGGTNRISNQLYLGYNGGSNGRYTLSGGSLSVGSFEDVANSGMGTFNQSGGANTINSDNDLYLGFNSGSAGTYTLSGAGSLSASGGEVVGYSGTGNFNQTGGTNTSSNLYIANNSGSTGTYALSNAGSLSVTGSERVGYNGTGNFTQSGGTNTVVGELDLGEASGSAGTYTLNVGTANVSGNVYVGGSNLGPGGAGILNVADAGVLVVGGTLTIYSTGTLIQNGGSLSAAALNGNFTQNGGLATFDQITGVSQLTIYGGQTTLVPGGGPNQISVLTISGSGELDLTNNGLAIRYGTGSDPVAAIRSYLRRGYLKDTWTGTGITSSLAAANPSAFSVGYADGGNPADLASVPGLIAGEVEIKYTVAGDANLSGGVDLSDLVIIASDFGETGADWAEGDVNYDGNVELSDLVIVASNFGASLSSVQPSDFSGSFAAEWELALAEAKGADVQVPESASAALAIIGVFGLLSRRKRSITNNSRAPRSTPRTQRETGDFH
jgi:hypothetical protein